MATKRYRKVNKSKETTYEDIKDLTFNPIEQYGFGSWLKKNAGVIGTVVGAGAGMLLGPAGAIAGASLGAAGSIAGASLGASIGGSVGGAVSQSEMAKEQVQAQNEQAAAIEHQQELNIANQNLQQEMANKPLYDNVMKYGGTLNYGGQLHEGPNGGVPVDAMGNPNSMNPVALVEKGEVSYNTPDGGTYIYSDTLKYDKNKTFAKKAKDVQRRYKFRMKDGVINDPFAKKSYDNEMQDLLSKQEKLRSIVTPQEQPMMRTGGNLPKYDRKTPTLGNTSFLNFNPEASFNPWQPKGLDHKTLMQNYYRDNSTTKFSTPLDGSKLPPLVKPIDNTAAMDEFVKQVEMDYPSRLIPETANIPTKGVSAQLPKIKPYNSNRQLYQGMNWAETGLAAAAPVLGGITGLVLNSRRKAPTNLRLSRMTPQQINLERRRAAARESAGVATSNLTRSLRNAAPTAGSYMSNVVAGITDIDRNLSNQLGESYTQEELQNAQLRQQAETANLDIDMQEQMYNSQLQNQFDASKEAARNAYLSQIGQGITSALDQKFQSSRDADFLNMQNPDYAMAVTGKGLRRRKMILPRTQIGG